MTPAEIQALSAPISEDEPCGPDLEMTGDVDYMRFTARIEGVLPKSFASFDRASVDFAAEFETLKQLLSKSRDLRLFVYLAKLKILNRDLAGFAATVQTMQELAATQWDRLHPELLDGDAMLRIVSLQTLDDMPDAVMPLQSAPLFEARRFGKASYRSHLLATGGIQPRIATQEGEKDEEVPSADALRNALNDTEIEQLVQSRDLALGLKATLERLETLVNEKSGQPNALKYDRLAPLAKEIAAYLDSGVAARDPALAISPNGVDAGPIEDGETAGPGGGLTGPVRSQVEASAALAAAATYFARSEPSSPTLLLIGQAEALIGKSFYDAVQTLTPELVAQANIRIGRDVSFRLPIERLSSLTVTTVDSGSPAEEETSAESDSWDSPSDEQSSWNSDETSEDVPSDETEAAEGENDNPENREPDSEDGESSDGSPEQDGSDQDRRAPTHTQSTFRAVSRTDAVALLNQVAAYFRAVEPSSPVPTLLEHAGGLAGRDFFGLLRDMVPASTLRVDE